MSITIKHLIWAIALTISIVAIARYTAQTNISSSKDRAFMMDACSKAGGQWKKNGWTWDWECTR